MPGQILRFNDTELDVGRYEIRRNGPDIETGTVADGTADSARFAAG